ncbi:hypothetical protein Peur_073387 [Populus x canadensis]
MYSSVNSRSIRIYGMDEDGTFRKRSVLVLDSLNITVGNSSTVGRTIKDLMAVIRPYISILVGLEPESVNEFISSVTGRTSDVRLAGNTADMLKFGASTHWVLVFFSRMYMSCRSLYRQAVALMPPDVSRKMSTGSMADCCPLIYVLHTMALQKLVDLNRQIKSSEYMQQSNDNIVRFKHITTVKQEAADLTGFMMSYLSLLINEQLAVYSSNAGTCLDTCNQALHGSDKWVLDVCPVNEKSLPAAIWHLASRFCNLLEKSVLPLFGDTELNASPKWQEDLSALENSYVVSGRKSSTCDEIAVGKPISHLLSEMPADISRELAIMKFTACQSLLRLLCWMPKGYINSKSFSLYVTCTLNPERFVIGHLLECGDSFFSRKQYELLRLLVTCRKALKYLIMAYCEEKIGTAQSSPIPILSEDVLDSIIAEKPCTELPNSDVAEEQSSVNKSNPYALFKNAGDEIDVVDWNKLSSIVSCFCGFMWGLASALDHTNATDSDYKVKLLRWKSEPISKISHCINVFADFICFSFHMLFVEDDHQPEHLYDARNSVKSNDSSIVLGSGDSWKATVDKHSSQPDNCSTIASVLSKLDSYECQPLNKDWLQSFLKGNLPKAAVLIRQLLIAVSAILRLNLQTMCTLFLSSMVPSFTGISPVLLLKLADGTEGKEATLASRDKESSTKTLHSHVGSASLSYPYHLDEFKARLRMSFKNVGKVSSTVAAALTAWIWLWYMFQSSVAALFNTILHVQSPLIFYGIAMGSDRDKGPDPGAVILVCVEVLTRVSGKRALFQMDSWHGAQSLRIPAAFFQDFDQLRISEDPALSNSLFSDNQDHNPVAGMNSFVADQQFSVELYTLCCRLLYTMMFS